MRWFFLILALLVITLLVAVGERGGITSKRPFMLFPDMDNQYKVKFQKPSEFFVDGQGAQKPVEGTVPMGHVLPRNAKALAPIVPGTWPNSDSYFHTGTIDGNFGSGIPKELALDEDLLSRGKERYEIMCTPCHGLSGNGQGVVSKYWAIPPTANLIDGRVNAMPDGQIYWTIANGKGLMGPYSGTINVEDRWAITAYVRVLEAAATTEYEGDAKKAYDAIIADRMAAQAAATIENASAEEGSDASETTEAINEANSEVNTEPATAPAE